MEESLEDGSMEDGDFPFGFSLTPAYALMFLPMAYASVLEKVGTRLIREGVPGFCVTKVKGCGELSMEFFSHDLLEMHVRVEVYAQSEDAERFAQAILEEAHSGESGDGIVAISPVAKLFRIRAEDSLGTGNA